MAACRSCGAEILWATTENGKRIPIDPEPAERPSGLFKLEQSLLGLKAVSVAGEPVYLSHFVTCPNAAAHRKPAGEPTASRRA